MNRIFVEKRAEFAMEGRHLLGELRESLELPELTRVRMVQRYDVRGLAPAEFSRAVTMVLSEPQVDDVASGLATAEHEQAFAHQLLPGQFDQRADSAAQAIQILCGGERPEVDCATVVVIEGVKDEAAMAAVKAYLINPVDSHEVAVDGVEQRAAVSVPRAIARLDEFSAGDPETLRQEMGLAMSAADVAFCQEHFSQTEGRAPSETEIRVLDTYWSDHCRHTTFLTEISEIEFAPGSAMIERAWDSYLAARERLGRSNAPRSLMDIALIGMRDLRAAGKLENLEISNEVNAASIIVKAELTSDDGVTAEADWLVMFKNETHNHPTEIEPFGGAATCLGGCIRDPLSGRAYVYQAMRVTGAGDPRVPVSDTMPGKLPQRKICQGAARGYSSYGNQIGLATGQVKEFYHPGYIAKRMEIGAVVAAVPLDHVVRGSPAEGDVILLIGGRTGRDGVGGATGSSKEHTETALESSAEVQKGDAPTERKIQRLFRDAELTRKIKVCNDFGAGGVSVAIGEIAPSLRIDLDAVRTKYAGLDGTELAISESQERMAVCIDSADTEFFIRAAMAENLECVKVADVTSDGRLRMIWRGEQIVDLARDFLDTNGVRLTTRIRVTAPAESIFDTDEALAGSVSEHMSRLAQASQRGLGEMFDGSVGAATVLWPFGGECQVTAPDAMVAMLPVTSGATTTATWMSHGFDPQLSSRSPFHGAVYAVAEAVCRLVSAGAPLDEARLTLQEYFPKVGTDPERWGLPAAALLGAWHAQKELGIAAIGGKDSMSGTFQDLDVPPTLVAFAVAPGDARLVVSPEFKQVESMVSLIEIPRDLDGLPDFAALKVVAGILRTLQIEGKIFASRQIGRGGLAAALTEMAMGNRIGFEAVAQLPMAEWLRERFLGFVIEHSDELPAALGARTLGRTTADPILKLVKNEPGESLDALRKAWEAPLESVYPTQARDSVEDGITEIRSRPPLNLPKRPTRKSSPLVLIPAFPGTNSEYDSARAFQRAGATTKIEVFRNLDSGQVRDSIEMLAANIRKCQIFFIPGGFSAGDEPDGSAKFLSTILRNPIIEDALMDLIRGRDGLVLGICNGFQALVKTGLVTFGEIRDPEVGMPTLVHNSIGRHISRYVRTRVVNAWSPWFTESAEGDVHRIPLSHGEGRFHATPRLLERLVASGQIATQYCDAQGNPGTGFDFNPNDSIAAIEGITSPCGRIYGKMSHSERAGSLVTKNIPGNKIQPIFKAGVKWFD